MQHLRLAAALACCVLTGSALAWDSADGTSLAQASEGATPMTGLRVACPAQSPSIIVLVPDKTGLPAGGWGVVSANGAQRFLWLSGTAGGYAAYETDFLGDTTALDQRIVGDLKGGAEATVSIEVDAEQVSLGTVPLAGFTAAYDAFTAGC